MQFYSCPADIVLAPARFAITVRHRFRRLACPNRLRIDAYQPLYVFLLRGMVLSPICAFSANVAYVVLLETRMISEDGVQRVLSS